MFYAYFLFRSTIFNFNYIGKYWGLEAVGTIEGIAGNGVKLKIFISYESLNTLNLQIYQSIYPFLLCILRAVALMVTPSQFCSTVQCVQFSISISKTQFKSQRFVVSRPEGYSPSFILLFPFARCPLIGLFK